MLDKWLRKATSQANEVASIRFLILYSTVTSTTTSALNRLQLGT